MASSSNPANPFLTPNDAKQSNKESANSKKDKYISNAKKAHKAKNPKSL